MPSLFYQHSYTEFLSALCVFKIELHVAIALKPSTKILSLQNDLSKKAFVSPLNGIRGPTLSICMKQLGKEFIDVFLQEETAVVPLQT